MGYLCGGGILLIGYSGGILWQAAPSLFGGGSMLTQTGSTDDGRKSIDCT